MFGDRPLLCGRGMYRRKQNKALAECKHSKLMCAGHLLPTAVHKALTYVCFCVRVCVCASVHACARVCACACVFPISESAVTLRCGSVLCCALLQCFVTCWEWRREREGTQCTLECCGVSPLNSSLRLCGGRVCLRCCQK